MYKTFELDKKLIGPFKQIVTMRNMPLKGMLSDENLEIIVDGGILIEGEIIKEVASFNDLVKKHNDVSIDYLDDDLVAMPGFIDAHTHICFAGSRAKDFAARNSGKSYLEIAEEGGGIWDTVQKTRIADLEELLKLMILRLNLLAAIGVTTVEVKSGYGLSVENELKQLRTIKNANDKHQIDIISTCLAAHIVPKEFNNETEYLDVILNELVPTIQKEKLTKRFDVFIEKGAFSVSKAKDYIEKLQQKGFKITIHGDQFSRGGSQIAVEVGATSVDHLEVSGEKEIEKLSQSDTIPVVLPGASIGLGCNFAPARKLLDAGCSLVIASDWNPGSAPQGNLITQASILATFEKLSNAEVFAGITFRAAKALNLTDRGVLESGKLADIVAFPTNDFREILYHQGELKVNNVWKRGVKIK
ncbi:imidazolonepropionase [Urechidicola croceus]|uniref:Imidazolonepropionase n=1 Tax=Urechidicola croceus TaxID=1850246 RepID=A0A1D8P5E4_9FLAO|nr:imidazolonepropionase [Urechidicola croceus]AOW19805.1 imidazolonepropionase [Urechidicola croceus]